MVEIHPLKATINLKDKAKVVPYKHASSKPEVYPLMAQLIKW